MASLRIAALVAFAILGVAWLYLGLPYLVKRRARSAMTEAVRRAGCVCLTFDDGPDPRGTPAILDLLAESGARATFFLLGSRALEHPDLVERIAREGHEVAEHGFAHADPWADWSARDLAKGRRALARWLPRRGALLRPPYGRVALPTLLYTWLRGRRLALWSVNPIDDRCETGREVADRVVPQLAPGGVVLMHDARRRDARHAKGDSPQPTVDGLRIVLEELARRGIAARTLREATGEGRHA